MQLLKKFGKWFWRFMVIFSFIVNFVLIVVLLVAGLYIFEIKKNVADPLIGGLHSTAVGLHDATIDWTIPVRDRIPVVLNIPLQTQTTVVLTAPVPLRVGALIDLPGLNASNVQATVNLTLPAGLELPVSLDLNVPVDEELDVALDVRAVIPLSETQLADPIDTLGLLFEPLAIGLHNLPKDFSQAGDFVGKVLGGAALDQLLLATDGSGFNPAPYDAWLGYSRTAGNDYALISQPYPAQNLPLTTGIVPPGGIPGLDALIRPELYANGANPAAINAQAAQSLSAAGIDPVAWNGGMAAYYQQVQASLAQPAAEPVPDQSGSTTEAPVSGESGTSADTQTQDYGIIPTPTGP
jgi:hypothetical protein